MARYLPKNYLLLCVVLISCPLALAAPCGDVNQGKKIFERLTCAGCHPNGSNSLHPDQPLKGTAFLKKYKDDLVLEKAIRKGFPRSGMPPFGKDKINEKDMKDLIAYIRSLTPKRPK